MIRIGPAGLGSTKSALETLEKYYRLGFRACEIAFVHGVYIKNKEDAEKIGLKARELGIRLSIHAPYYVNLNSDDKSKIESTKKRILDCCKVAEWLGGAVVVVHPGYYGKDKDLSYEHIKKELADVVSKAKLEYPMATIAPETMGKVNVFGSIEEISKLAKETGSGFCIDFAHILARDKKVDYELVESFFPGQKWHVHFSGIEYGEKGEKNHRTTKKEEWAELLENLPKDKDITIICESPSMFEDCSEALKIAQELNLALAQ